MRLHLLDVGIVHIWLHLLRRLRHLLGSSRLRLRRRLLLMSRRVDGAFQNGKTGSNLSVFRRKLCSATVSINGVCVLAATFVERTQIVPDLRHIWIQSDCARISIHRITILIHLVIQDANRAPKRCVSTISVHSLLIGIVGLAKFAKSHVHSTKQVPGLTVSRIELRRTLQQANSLRGVVIMLVL